MFCTAYEFSYHIVQVKIITMSSLDVVISSWKIDSLNFLTEDFFACLFFDGGGGEANFNDKKERGWSFIRQNVRTIKGLISSSTNTQKETNI